MTDIVERARETFAAYSGLGRDLVDEMIAEVERLRAQVNETRTENERLKIEGEESGELLRWWEENYALVESLRAEVKEMTNMIERLRAQTNNAIAKQYDAEGEVERLRAEVAEWKERYEAERRDHYE